MCRSIYYRSSQGRILYDVHEMSSGLPNHSTRLQLLKWINCQWRGLRGSSDVLGSGVVRQTYIFQNMGCHRHHHHHRFQVGPSWLVPIQNLTSETYESIVGHLVGLLGRGISPSQCRYLHRTAQCRKTRIHAHVSSGIRTHVPSVRAVEDSMYFRLSGHWDRRTRIKILTN